MVGGAPGPAKPLPRIPPTARRHAAALDAADPLGNLLAESVGAHAHAGRQDDPPHTHAAHGQANRLADNADPHDDPGSNDRDAHAGRQDDPPHTHAARSQANRLADNADPHDDPGSNDRDAHAGRQVDPPHTHAARSRADRLADDAGPQDDPGGHDRGDDAGRRRGPGPDPAIPATTATHDDGRLIYLDGNSLGRLTGGARRRLLEVVDEEWAVGLVRSWESWIDLPHRVGDAIARHLVGARSGEVVVGDSTTVNLYKAAAAAIAHAGATATALVTDDDNFPTDRYVLEGLAAQHGLDYREVPSDPIDGPDPDRLGASLDDAALLCLSHVAYRSGALADMAGLTRLAHDHGALVLWDLSHSVGAVPIDLTGTEADLAVGCTYKYLNGGPGAPAFSYVRQELQAALRQPIWGWFGRRDQFTMGQGYDPAPGIGAWLSGTPSILGLACVEEGVRLIAEAGVDRLRAKGMALTSLVVDLADAWLAPLGFTLASPRSAARRGSHVALAHPEARRISQALVDRAGVVPDFRAPDRLRLGPAPIATRYVDVWDAMDRLRHLVATGLHQDADVATRRVT